MTQCALSTAEPEYQRCPQLSTLPLTACGRPLYFIHNELLNPLVNLVVQPLELAQIQSHNIFTSTLNCGMMFFGLYTAFLSCQTQLVKLIPLSSRPRQIEGHFIFLPFLNNHTNSCHPITKLQHYNLVLDIFWQLFGLVYRCGEVGVE